MKQLSLPISAYQLPETSIYPVLASKPAVWTARTNFRKTLLIPLRDTDFQIIIGSPICSIDYVT